MQVRSVYEQIQGSQTDGNIYGREVTQICSDRNKSIILIRLVYLTYEEVSESYDESDEKLTGLAHIPNEEVRS